MRAPLAPLATAWLSYRKQRLLWWATLLLLFPSLFVGNIIQAFFLRRELFPIAIIILLATIAIHTWGQACILIAGKGRRSFRSLLRDARPLIIPLLLTGILRQCFTLLWGLLLILPGIIYNIRTVLFDAVIAREGQQYRQALRRSALIVRQNTWRTIGIIVATYVLFFLPAYLPEALPLLFPPLSQALPWHIGILFAKNMILAGGMALSLLTHLALYQELLTSGLAPSQEHLPPEECDETPTDD